MSCSVPRLLSYYSDKVNIYTSNCFVKLPPYKTCPPPPTLYLAQDYTNRWPYGSCGPCPTQQTSYPNIPFCAPCATSSTGFPLCGPCGR